MWRAYGHQVTLAARLYDGCHGFVEFRALPSRNPEVLSDRRLAPFSVALATYEAGHADGVGIVLDTTTDQTNGDVRHWCLGDITPARTDVLMQDKCPRCVSCGRADIDAVVSAVRAERMACVCGGEI